MINDSKITVEELVINKIRKRREAGIKKYGISMERGDLSTMQWLTHLQEELMDASIYVEKLLQVAGAEKIETPENEYKEELQAFRDKLGIGSLTEQEYMAIIGYIHHYGLQDVLNVLEYVFENKFDKKYNTLFTFATRSNWFKQHYNNYHAMKKLEKHGEKYNRILDSFPNMQLAEPEHRVLILNLLVKVHSQVQTLSLKDLYDYLHSSCDMESSFTKIHNALVKLAKANGVKNG